MIGAIIAVRDSDSRVMGFGYTSGLGYGAGFTEYAVTEAEYATSDLCHCDTMTITRNGANNYTVA